jgi:hypothetical protein
MRRRYLAVGLFTVACSFSGVAQTLLDPVGFCNVPATASECTTATGLGGETIGISSATTFGMFKNGNGGTAASPWDLLVAIPDYTGTAPTITNTIFTQQGSTQNLGHFLYTSGSLYTFAGTSGDSSMSAHNMFCDGTSYPCTTSNEIHAFGSLPAFFDVFEYSFAPAISNNTAYTFDVGGSGLPDGTFLAAAGGTNPFTTPFTVTGLIDAPPAAVPEPSSILLLATLSLAIAGLWRVKRETA